MTTQQSRIYLTPKQREADKLLQENTVLLYGGGIQGGKSFFGLMEIMTMALQYPNSRWLAMRKTLPTIKLNLIPSFVELLEMGFRQYIERWNQSTNVVKFTNGSELIFMAESHDTDKELNRFRGMKINGALLDEVNEMQEKTFNKVIERAGSWDGSPGCPIKIICTCNPSWGWVKENIYTPWKQGKLKKGWAFIPALIYDNPYKPKTYIDSLVANMPAYEFEVFVKGNWDVKLDGILFGEHELRRFTMDDITCKEGEHKGKIIQAEAILAYGDIADEGIDYFSMPVARVYKDKVFITDVYFTNANTNITIPGSAEFLKEHHADFVRIESNNQGSIFGKELAKLIGGDKIYYVHNSASKHSRILMEVRFILNHVYFLHPSQYADGSQYDQFIRSILKYMKDGSTTEDDAIDSLSGLCMFIKNFLPHLF